MHDFGELVYLDPQKTGSTFVSSFLRNCCRLQEHKWVKHGRLENEYRSDSFYFISVRHPLSNYSSLFRYGLDGKGWIYDRLTKLGKASLYENSKNGFEHWLAFMLNSDNATFLEEGFELEFVRNFEIGFLSFRFLMLALDNPLVRLKEASVLENPLAVVKDKLIFDHVIKNEELRKNLLQLAIDLFPHYFDQFKSVTFLKNVNDINASSRADVFSANVSSELLFSINEKERILMEYYVTENSENSI